MIFTKEFRGNVEIQQDVFNMLKACVSVDDSRQSLCNVRIDDGKITATDGRVLVQYTADLTISGWYEPAKVGAKYLLLPVDYDYTPPTYGRVIPDYPVSMTNDGIIITGKKSDMSSDSRAICEIIYTTENYFNLDYLWNLKHAGTVFMSHGGAGKAVRFDGPDMIYIIMPMVI
jgi:hypothetical protein